ncbi:DNA-directed RNA polymerase [Suillus subaureus]|uniref:DNA-directed RNA polymerases I and III subunit RPAC1 n=1 Tax=Suillus subaureus TaxID=48587 RepID=A0A9P7E5A5_9AGAM|nr:DNA-directed RNA polymerase [Suillus subaureus]KAG1811142.1 DNA-directed RNA polymerase [Suillus subaureus]
MPPAITYDPRKHVGVHPERVSHVSSTNFPGHHPDEDHSWDLERFKKGLTVKIERLSNRSIEFDLVGVDASIANAYRRILIAEVPTICVERVYVWDNTSVVVDEVFAQRIGLVPLNVDPALMDMKQSQNDQATDRNTLVFRLQVSCERRKNAPKDTTDPNKLYINHEVLSSHLKWVPQGEQEIVLADNPPAPTNLNIVLTKLRPGQEVDMELHAVKGVGKDHAKFCPVATASYRLLPLVILNPEKPVPRELAEKFQKCFSSGVIRVDPRTKAVSVDSKKMRNETMSREVYRHPEFEGCVQLARVRDHFLFNIESEGFYPPQRLLPEAIAVMRAKIATVKRAAEMLLNNGDDLGDVAMANA